MTKPRLLNLVAAGLFLWAWLWVWFSLPAFVVLVCAAAGLVTWAGYLTREQKRRYREAVWARRDVEVFLEGFHAPFLTEREMQ